MTNFAKFASAKFAMANRTLRDFQVGEFFRSLQNILTSSLENTSFDSAEYLSRRLDELERTLSVLLRRNREAYPTENQLLTDLNTLLENVCERRQHYQELSFRRMLDEDEQNTSSLSVGIIRSGVVGRPRFDISENILQGLHNGAGFRWAEIARNLGVSERTLRRRRLGYGMIIGTDEQFSNMEDVQLDLLVRQILHVTPGLGYRLVQGALRQRGVRVQRWRILQSLQRIDPITATLRASRTIIRRRYSVPCPNALW